MPDVNSQIVDSVASVVTLTSGSAPSQSFGMLDTVLAEAFGMAMYNAVNRQQSGSMISSAAVTAACARMLGGPLGPIAIPPDPLPEPPCPPPGVQPLPPVPHLAPAQVIASAAAGAELAVDAIRQAESYYDAAAAAARESLQEIAAEASAPTSPPPPPHEVVDKPADTAAPTPSSTSAAPAPLSATVAPDPCPPPLTLEPPCPPPPPPPPSG